MGNNKLNTIKKNLLEKVELFKIPNFKNFYNINSSKHENNKLLFYKITENYKNYVSKISSPDMAISLELSHFIYAYCLEHKPLKLLDLGSGFSSFVFRFYQKYNEPNSVVYSVDDNKEWLLKTKNYLTQFDLNTDYLFDLDEFQKNNTQIFFDLILLDLNYVEKRKDFIDFAAKLLKHNSLLIIDDVHKIEFLRQVKAISKTNNYKLFNIRKQTIDSFGRFSLVLTK